VCRSPHRQVSGLCLLDLTAAFDTVDHELLLLRLNQTFGVRRQAIEWLKSYLRYIRRRNIISYPSDLFRTAGFSPVSAAVYLSRSANLADLASKFSVIRLEQCATAIGHWIPPPMATGVISANWLKLNAEKTELLWAGTRHSV